MKKGLLCLTFLVAGFPSYAKTANVHVNALPLILGLIDLEVDFRVNEKITVGPTLLSWNFKLLDTEISASGLGVRGNYHFHQAFEDSWYASVYASTLSVKATTADLSSSSLSSEISTTTYGIAAGYNWCWTMSNLWLGYGFGAVADNKVTYSDGTTDDVPAQGGFEFRYGLIF